MIPASIVHEKTVVGAETSQSAEIKKLSAGPYVTIPYPSRASDHGMVNLIVNQKIRRCVFLLEHASPFSADGTGSLRRARVFYNG